MKRKTISFRLEGTIKVPVNVKLSEVKEGAFQMNILYI